MFLLTMQCDATGETKTKTVATQQEVDSWCDKAQKVATATIYDDKHDGTGNGLVRTMGLIGSRIDNTYTLTVFEQ